MNYTQPILLGLLPVLSLLGQANDSNADRATLDEIAVTGSSIPDLDLSRSSILTQDQVEDRQINNLVNLSGLSPNLHINNNSIQSYGDIITMRGIANTQLFGPAGVQLYVDGIPQADISSYSSTLYDIESIEILRGPQGHKFGKSVTGGAINIKTKAPSDQQINRITASYGTFETQEYNINSSGPLDGNGFSYSVALQRALSDGYINNTSGNADTSETWHGSLRFLLDRGKGIKIGFGANFETHELGAQPLVLRNQADFYSRSTDFDESTEIDRNQQFLTFENELDEYSFFSITNRNDWSMNPNRVDLDTSTVNTLASPAQTSVIIQDQIEWSQEFRLESEEGSEIDWVLGAFYSDSEIDGDATRSFGVTEQTVYKLESRNLAIFATLAKDLTENDNLSLGLRYDNFEKKMDRTKDGFNFVFDPVLNTFIPTPFSDTDADSNNFDSFSPTLNWERKITEGLTGNLRATYSEKPGGFSAYTVTDSQITFLEEETLSYEIGLLFAPTESWGLNLTAYLNDIENYQFELPDLNPLSTDYYVDNADEVTTQGIEIEGYFKPSENFTFSVAYGLCDSEYDKFDGSGLVGEQVSFIPEHTLALSLNYEFDNGLYGQIGTKTIGDTHYWNYDGSNPTDRIDSYTLLDANLGYDWKDWDFNVFGLNLTDEEYYTSLVNNLPTSPGVAGSPRVIGLSISKEF
ncbi:MAG: TonB-dependent receptor [Verrucomicrobiota bacterium]|nr:TonB-dependent receptor [Verrucomicrobiota bacterium]